MSNPVEAKVPQQKEEVIDLGQYWAIIMQYKWRIVGLVSVITLLALMVSFSLEKVYRATTMVLIESEQARVVSIEDVYGVNTGGKEYFITQFEILKSRELSERVVRRLKLNEHALFDPRQQKQGFSLRSLIPTDKKTVAPTEEEILQDVVDSFRQGLVISPVRNTQLVKVSYELSDAKLAALIANTLAKEYIDSHREAKLSVTVEAASWITGRLEGLRSKLRESESRLQEYREQADLVNVGGVNSLGQDELEELTQRYVEASKTRSEAETLYLQVKRMGVDPPADQLMRIPMVLLHPLVQNLKEQQSLADRKVAELSERYGPKHPKMIAVKLDAEQAKYDLAYQVKSVADGFYSEYRGARQTELALKEQISSSRERYQGVNRKEFKLLELERDVNTNRQLYDMFLTRAKETSEAEGLQAAHARVVDPAVTPRIPVKPQKKLIVMLAMVVSSMLGVMLAFFLESLNNTIRTPDEIEDKLGLPVLGFLPLELKNKSKLPYEGFKLSETGGFTEAMRTVRTALMLSSIDDPHKITLVTSSIPGEGKSTVALNLSRALGQVEKVLLIDADMRRPTISRVTDLPRGSAGLSNIVAGTASLKDVIFKMDDYDVDVISSGMIPNNPLELLSSKRFAQVLDKLKEHYDRIIIDSAPTHAVSDSLVLAQSADAVVYVVKADSTAAPVVQKGLARLKEVNAPVVGAVLSQVDVSKSGRYGGYYENYYTNYGYASDEQVSQQKVHQTKRDDELDYSPKKALELSDV